MQDQLGETERRELEAMNRSTDKKQKLQWLIEKEKWDRIQTHFHVKGIRATAQFLSPYAAAGKTLVTVGSGMGFDLRMMENHVTFSRIIASDISWTAAHTIEKSIRSTSGTLGLLACDFQRCPVKLSSDVVGFAYEALHHSDDVHRTIDILLNHFEHLVFVEPTRNWLVNIAARFGLSMNIEYSGLKPDWISLRRLRQTAQRRGYRMEASTWWPFPDWAVPKLFKQVRSLGSGLCRAVDGVSCLTRPFKFGAMSAVHLWKNSNQAVETMS